MVFGQVLALSIHVKVADTMVHREEILKRLAAFTLNTLTFTQIAWRNFGV